MGEKFTYLMQKVLQVPNSCFSHASLSEQILFILISQKYANHLISKLLWVSISGISRWSLTLQYKVVWNLYSFTYCLPLPQSGLMPMQERTSKIFGSRFKFQRTVVLTTVKGTSNSIAVNYVYLEYLWRVVRSKVAVSVLCHVNVNTWTQESRSL